MGAAAQKVNQNLPNSGIKERPFGVFLKKMDLKGLRPSGITETIRASRLG